MPSAQDQDHCVVQPISTASLTGRAAYTEDRCQCAVRPKTDSVNYDVMLDVGRSDRVK